MTPPASPGIDDPSPRLISRLESLFALRLDPVQRRRVAGYVELLDRWNRRVNLTAVNGLEERLRLLFFESFWLADRFLKDARRVADVGTGAGFPGLPAKIFLPSLELILIEPNHKKATFLKEVLRRLDLQAEVFEGRGEDYPSWEGVEIALMRALKPAPTLLEILGRHGVLLLRFHAREGDTGLESAEFLRREAVPGAGDRFAALYRPGTGRLRGKEAS